MYRDLIYVKICLCLHTRFQPIALCEFEHLKISPAPTLSHCIMPFLTLCCEREMVDFYQHKTCEGVLDVRAFPPEEQAE